MLASDLCVVVASNDEEVLRRNLLASPLVAGGVELHIERSAPSATVAYNRGLDTTRAPYVIFAHHDVYFPRGWEALLGQAIATVSRQNPDWALIGPFGISLSGEYLGDVWSTSLGRRVGQPVRDPALVQGYDELAFVLRRDSGLRFDEELSFWHMYGTDIVQSAQVKGLNAWVANLPLVHNDKSKRGLIGADFDAAYHFIRRKWRNRLPLRTSILLVTRSGLSLPIWRLRGWQSGLRHRDVADDPTIDPRHYAALCGWE